MISIIIFSRKKSGNWNQISVMEGIDHFIVTTSQLKSCQATVDEIFHWSSNDWIWLFSNFSRFICMSDNTHAQWNLPLTSQTPDHKKNPHNNTAVNLGAFLVCDVYRSVNRSVPMTSVWPHGFDVCSNRLSGPAREWAQTFSSWRDLRLPPPHTARTHTHAQMIYREQILYTCVWLREDNYVGMNSESVHGVGWTLNLSLHWGKVLS
jgi:hypothetical protein